MIGRSKPVLLLLVTLCLVCFHGYTANSLDLCADEPGVTHMVFPFGPGGDPDDGKEYTTVVAVK